LDWFEGVELKLQCSNDDVLIKKLKKREIKPSETDRSGDDYNIWTVRPDKFFEDQCFTTAFVGASLSYPRDKQRTKKWYPSISIDGVGANVSVDFPSCHFPFKAKPGEHDPQETSYQCLGNDRDDGQCWCSPTDDADRDKLFLLCPCAADRPGYQVHTKPRPELESKRCRLPFKFQGKRYFTCTKDGHPEGKCWCKVNRYTNQEDYEYKVTAVHLKLFEPDDRDWGECPCPTTTVYGEFDSWQSWSGDCECRKSQHRVRSCKFPADLKNPLRGLIPVCFGQPTELRYCSCDYSGKKKYKFLDEMINIRELVKATPDFHRTGSLDLGNAKPEQNGIYYCVRSRVDKNWKWLQGELGWIYRVNVVPERLTQTLLNSETTNNEEINKNLKVPDIQVEGWEMWINWTNWVGCDRCNDRGEDKRIGFCMMRPKTGFNAKSCLPKSIPCGGFKNFEDFDEKTEAAAYIEVRRCTVTCDNEKVVRKITHEAKGDGFPPLPNKARRTFIAPIVGSDLDLECAESDHLRPVSWYFFPYNKTGHHNLHKIPYNYSQVGTSLPNYRIAPNGVLVLKNIRFEDEGYYNCHVNLRLKVSYAVVPRHRNWAVVILSFLSYLTYSVFYAMVIIIFSVFYYNQFRKCSADGMKEGWTLIKESNR